MRILVLLAIALLLFVIISNLLRKGRRPRSVSHGSEHMVRCEYCGLHVPEKEALQEGERYFCSARHLEAHRQSR